MANREDILRDFVDDHGGNPDNKFVLKEFKDKHPELYDVKTSYHRMKEHYLRAKKRQEEEEEEEEEEDGDDGENVVEGEDGENAVEAEDGENAVEAEDGENAVEGEDGEEVGKGGEEDRGEKRDIGKLAACFLDAVNKELGLVEGSNVAATDELIGIQDLEDTARHLESLAIIGDEDTRGAAIDARAKVIEASRCARLRRICHYINRHVHSIIALGNDLLDSRNVNHGWNCSVIGRHYVNVDNDMISDIIPADMIAQHYATFVDELQSSFHDVSVAIQKFQKTC